MAVSAILASRTGTAPVMLGIPRRHSRRRLTALEHGAAFPATILPLSGYSFGVQPGDGLLAVISARALNIPRDDRGWSPDVVLIFSPLLGFL